ncbi:MAG TPA: hypothetical protein VNZ64_11265 [Candidatus Acidoferrum sp.]|nr:hypothetical protein [Candidatus Acidoferrum sp.]
MYNGQMELGLGNGKPCPSVDRRQRRISRAQWWFQRMRQVVERVIEPQPEPRPEQLVFAGTHRQALAESAPPKAGGSTTRRAEERQICE